MAQATEKLLRLPTVIERVGLKRTAIYDRIKIGTFPRPVPLDGCAVAWLESEIIEWQRRQIERRTYPNNPTTTASSFAAR